MEKKVSNILELEEADNLCPKSGRRLADLWTFKDIDAVYLNEGTYINAFLVEEGLALLWKSSSEPDFYLRLLLTKAILEGKGMFSEKIRGTIKLTPYEYKKKSKKLEDIDPVENMEEES